jgi:hypothetical protein
METLPPEILYNILGSFEIKDQVDVLSKVCKLWKYVCDDLFDAMKKYQRLGNIHNPLPVSLISLSDFYGRKIPSLIPFSYVKIDISFKCKKIWFHRCSFVKTDKKVVIKGDVVFTECEGTIQNLDIKGNVKIISCDQTIALEDCNLCGNRDYIVYIESSDICMRKCVGEINYLEVKDNSMVEMKDCKFAWQNNKQSFNIDLYLGNTLALITITSSWFDMGGLIINSSRLDMINTRMSRIRDTPQNEYVEEEVVLSERQQRRRRNHDRRELFKYRNYSKR